MATITLGNVRTLDNPLGINAQICKVSLSVSWSSGDVHVIGKLPHGAVPLEAVFYAGPASPTTFIGKFGTSRSAELFFVSDSWADVTTCVRSTLALGSAKMISLSDDVRNAGEPIIMTATAGISIGHVCDLIVYYRTGVENTL